MSWHEGRLAAFDIETTGVDYEEARIVTACVAMVGGGEPTEATTWLLNPGVEIPDGAAEVHGVTTERAQAEGTDPAEGVREIVALLAAALQDGVPIVAFNARFDLTILDREARRYGIEPLDGLRVIDPFVLDKHLDRFRKGKRTLEVVCSHYRAELDGAHTADSDAVAAARVAWRMGQAPELAGMSLEELHRAQVEWAAEQARSLQDYFRRQGKSERVEPVWPVVPVPEAVAA